MQYHGTYGTLQKLQSPEIHSFLLFNHKRQDKSQVSLSQLVEGLLQETSIIINFS